MLGGIVTSVVDDPTSPSNLIVTMSDRPAAGFRSERVIVIERNLDTEKIQIGDRVWVTSAHGPYKRGYHKPSPISDCKKQVQFVIVSAGPSYFLTPSDSGCRHARKNLPVVSS